MDALTASPSPASKTDALARGGPVVLYDGVCGFCQAIVAFLLVRDVKLLLRFAALQSLFARRALESRGYDATRLNTLYVLVPEGAGEVMVYRKSDAVIFLGHLLGYRVLAALLSLLPRFLRDFGYDVIARIRYLLWGRKEECYVPTPKQRAQFIDG